MSPWNGFGWYQSAPKRPPPKHGIKIKKIGSTWWGKRWIEALERLSRGYSTRLDRGRTYARAGRVHEVVVKAGRVSARVTGSSATPYRVTITLAKLGDAVWSKAVAAMAGKAHFSAELLAGQMPQEIDAAFKSARASLFPVKEADLSTECDCPDWANPCKHVAATHYVLGEALDRDPFLLFELRGRSKAKVLGALRAARTDGEAERPSRKGARHASSSGDAPEVVLGKLAASDYDVVRGPLPALHFSFETPPISAGLLRQLGTPAGWASTASPAELFAPMVGRAAEEARELALAEIQPEGEPAPDTAPPTRASTGGGKRRAPAPSSQRRRNAR